MVVQSLKELWKEFKWLEFCPSRLHYDWMMTYSEMIRERDKEHYKGREMFISRYAYDRDNPYSGPLLSNLYFDFDDEKNPNRAKADCLSAAEYFNETYKIPFETMKIRFTGGKGFSLEIPFQFYNVKPTKHLNKIWKKIAVRVKTINQLKTCDENVYDRRRLWRLTNSRHRSGCYKIPLTYHELQSMAIREIKNLARKGPRKYLYISDMKRDYKPVPALENWFKEIQDEVLKEWNEQIERIIEKLGKETPIPKDFDQKKIWYCVQQRIQKGVNINEGKFRREPTAFNIAVALHRLGASDDYIRSRLEEFAKSCIPEFPNERYKDFDQILNMVHAHEYSTHCFTPCFAELCDKSQCWLFKEAETTLENIDFEEDVKLKVIDGAGGFNEDFIYETFSVMSQYGEICWILVWFDGKEAGMEIIADETKVRKFIEIKGETYKVWNVPCLYLETLWGKKSAYEFVQTKKNPKPQDVYERVESIVRYFADCDDGTEAVDGRYVFGALKPIFTIAKIFCPDKISALMNYVEETKAVMEELQASAEKEGMLRVLINVYQKDGWYALKGFAELFKEQMEWKKCSSQRASQILKNLGLSFHREFKLQTFRRNSRF